jgi:hypothetical protein
VGQGTPANGSGYICFDQLRLPTTGDVNPEALWSNTMFTSRVRVIMEGAVRGYQVLTLPSFLFQHSAVDGAFYFVLLDT